MRRWTILIGLGLALLPIHNEYLTQLLTREGQVLFFLPAIGWVLLAVGVGLFVLVNWKKIKEDWPDKQVWIPLAVIVGAIALSGFVNGDTLSAKFSPLFMGLCMFGVFLVARVLGEDIFKMLVPFVIVGSISVIVLGILDRGQYTGGFITNYCASAGYLLFAVLVYEGGWKIPLMLLAGVGVFFIGALEAVFIIGVLGIVLLGRRDFDRKLALVAGGLLIVIGVWGALGHLIPLYEGNNNLMVLRQIVTGKIALNGDTMTALTTGRWPIIVDSVRNFSFIGHGFSLSTVGGGIVHNMPLIILWQVGPLAALAWVFVSFRALAKTGWKYIWVAVLAMGVFDHYLWTQMAPWWWALVGVTTVSNLRSDLIFRKVVATT